MQIRSLDLSQPLLPCQAHSLLHWWKRPWIGCCMFSQYPSYISFVPDTGCLSQIFQRHGTVDIRLEACLKFEFQMHCLFWTLAHFCFRNSSPQLAHYPRFFTTSTHTADNSAYVVSYTSSQNKGPEYLLVIGNIDDLVLNFKTNRKALPFWLGWLMDRGHIICL